jgi:hypothetical protein
MGSEHVSRLVLSAVGSGVVLSLLAACAGLEGGDDTARPSSTSAHEPGKRTVEVAVVAWPNSANLSLAARAELTSDARRAVAGSALPVLVPAESALVRSARVIVEERFFAVSAQADSIHVSLHATRVAHRYPRIGPIRGDRTLRGSPGFVTRNEGIWSATWKESGVSYVLDLECGAASDARCAGEGYLLELVERLAYVGGLGESSP